MARRLLFLLPLLAACNPILPDQSVPITSMISVSAAEAVTWGLAGYAAFRIIDPLAPNWEIMEQKMGDNRWRVILRRKRFATGGDGEPLELFRRQAEEIVAREKALGYEITAFTQGIDSETTLARRWARGSIDLQPRVTLKASAPAPTAARAPSL